MNKQEQLKYMVRVSCMTYNHVNYITDAMNGFTMQKTTFPYVCTLLDDASTDGEQKVINNYLQEHFDLEDKSVVRNEETDDYVLTFAQHKTNRNCYFAVLCLKYNHYSIKKTKESYIKEWMDSKYIALCEGDDYWTDPFKLQKQVVFLESHADVSLVFSRCHVLCAERYIDEEYPNFKGIDDCYFNSEQIFTKWVIPTATILCRSVFFPSYTDNRIYAGDIVLNLSMAEKGRVFGMSDYTAVYRINEDGLTISRKKDSLVMWERYVGHIQFLSENFTSVSKRCYNKALQNVYCNIFNIKYDSGICDYKSLLHIFRLSPLKAVELTAGKLIIRVFHLNKGSRIRSLYRRIRYPKKDKLN